MYTTLYHTIAIPFLVTAILVLGLHALGRLLLLSPYRRSRHLFAETPWLPLRREEVLQEGEEIEFPSSGKVTLRGTFLTSRQENHRGTILFCHELNGSRANVAPYVEDLVRSGFHVFTFDFRNHGLSDQCYRGQSTPWITTADLDDVRSAIGYLRSRPDVDIDRIGVFGLGKGATLALCIAGSDSRLKSVVLDAPMPENRLFDRNCWQALVKSAKLSKRRSSKFVSLLFRAILYSVTCPFASIALAWRRFMLGLWYDCRFVNPWAYVKKVQQPIMILHGHVDSKTRAEQIQAFCDRMPIRPKLWLVSVKNRDEQGGISDDCRRQVARFFEEAL